MKIDSKSLAVALVILVLGFAAGSMYAAQEMNQRLESLEQEVDELESGNTVTINSSGSDLPALFDKVDQSVVSIQSYGTETSQGSQGTGFVYNSSGYIVTNQHVVEGASEIDVTLEDGTVKEATVVGTDVYSDLAVLEIEADGLQELEIGDNSNVRVGQTAVAIGNPFRLSSSMTAGIISQKERLLQVEDGFSIPNVLQTDAAINPGNSGGPLLNAEGEVVGVNTAIQSNTGTFSGVGFAIPANTVERVVPEIIEEGDYRHSWIGVRGRDLTPEMKKAMDLDVESGFMILSVVEESPAAEAGLEGTRDTEVVDGEEVPVGGDVVVAIDDEKVRGISDVLLYLARNTEPGDTVELTVIRDGERVDVPVTLSSRQSR